MSAPKKKAVQQGKECPEQPSPNFQPCNDLDLCSQGQAVRAFFIRMGFSLILSKVQRGF